MNSLCPRASAALPCSALLLAALLSAPGCGAPDAPATVGATQAALDAAAPVRLLYAKAYNYGCSSCASWGGVIDVADLAYDKQVTVLARREGGTDFVETAARYLRKLPSGRELWGFDGVGGIGRTELAIRYRVAGAEYWDSRAGANYPAYADLIDGFGLVGLDQPLGSGIDLAVTDIAVSPPARGHATATVSIEATVRNLAYDKEVAIVASTDHWATVRTGSGGYRYGSGGERWNILLDFDPGADGIDFAVSLRTAGREVWDNNFGRNFSCRRDPGLLIWNCDGLALLSCAGAFGCAPLP